MKKILALALALLIVGSTVAMTACGKDKDKELYLKKANFVREGYQKLIETEKYSYNTDRQAKLVRPLYLKR